MFSVPYIANGTPLRSLTRNEPLAAGDSQWGDIGPMARNISAGTEHRFRKPFDLEQFRAGLDVEAGTARSIRNQRYQRRPTNHRQDCLHLNDPGLLHVQEDGDRAMRSLASIEPGR
jgi:hypothetical protein